MLERRDVGRSGLRAHRRARRGHATDARDRTSRWPRDRASGARAEHPRARAPAGALPTCRTAPGASRATTVADAGEQGVDRDAATRVICGHRHRRSKQRLGELEVREIQGQQRPSGQDVGPKRPVRELGSHRHQDLVGATHVAGHDQVLGSDQTTAMPFVICADGRQPGGLLSQLGRHLRCPATGGTIDPSSSARATDSSAPDRPPATGAWLAPPAR